MKEGEGTTGCDLKKNINNCLPAEEGSVGVLSALHVVFLCCLDYFRFEERG